MKILSFTSSCLTLALSLSMASSAMAAEKQIEVMHPWSSGGEAAALQILKNAVEKAGIKWVDSAIAGAGGQNQTQALQARIASGNPPASNVAPGQMILEFAAQKELGDLTNVGNKENKINFRPIRGIIEKQKFAKLDGKWVASPFNMHRENTVYYNKAILDANGGKAPESWDEFLAFLEKVKKDGKTIPLAIGGEDWQEMEIFSSILIGQAGVDYYKKAIMGLDKEALGNDKMVAALETLRKVLSYADVIARVVIGLLPRAW